MNRSLVVKPTLQSCQRLSPESLALHRLSVTKIPVYREFFSLLAAEYDPQDTGDWLIVKDLVDLHWERLRERRLKPEVIKIYQEEPAEGSGQPIFIIYPEDARL